MIIRWVPAVVRVISYFSNVMLISSFLGLGAGCLIFRRGGKGLFRFFPAALTAFVLWIVFCSTISFGSPAEELRYHANTASLTNNLVLSTIFLFNAAMFVCLGEGLALSLSRSRTSRAYTADLLGSLAGTALFGIFSFLWFSPIAGFSIAAALYLLLTKRGERQSAAILLVAALLVVHLASGRSPTIWSPYHHITIDPPHAGPSIAASGSPTIYSIRINHDFYFSCGTLQPDSYMTVEEKEAAREYGVKYGVPHRFGAPARSVLILGSGGGMDVEAALLAGAEHVDAVEIDPVILDIGRTFHSGRPYQDARVAPHVMDARAFLRHTDRMYDRIVFGYLDSQGLFSFMSNVRLDGYVYTVESFREAFAHVAPGGALAVSFAAVRQDWLYRRLAHMLQTATGKTPRAFADMRGPGIILLAFKGAEPEMPDQFDSFRRISPEGIESMEVTSDDWPFLYLKEKTIPSDYRVSMAILLVLSILIVLSTRDRSPTNTETISSGVLPGSEVAHFFLLGFGFMLLETKCITEWSLLFGTSWLVTVLGVGGMLIMALAANLSLGATRKLTSTVLYIFLSCSLLAGLLLPVSNFLAEAEAIRYAAAVLTGLLPVFFAGLVFSRSFSTSNNSCAALGANLIGATAGGFAEYMGMIWGLTILGFLVAAAYTGSWIALSLAGNISQPPDSREAADSVVV